LNSDPPQDGKGHGPLRADPATPATPATTPSRSPPIDRRVIPERSPQFKPPAQSGAQGTDLGVAQRQREPLPQAAPALPVVPPHEVAQPAAPPPPPPAQPQLKPKPKPAPEVQRLEGRKVEPP